MSAGADNLTVEVLRNLIHEMSVFCFPMLCFALVLLVYVAGMKLSTSQVKTQSVDEEQRQPRELKLTKELIESILSNLSSGCRAEMEAAMAQSRGEISDDCKQDIQASLHRVTVSKGSQQDPAAFGREGGRNEPFESYAARTTGDKASASGNQSRLAGPIDPYTAIGGFAALVLAMLVSYVLYYNFIASSDRGLRLQKKLSKKKVHGDVYIDVLCIIL